MFTKTDKPLGLKSSASLLCNNLTVLNNADKGSLNYAVVHKYLINMVSTSTDGSQVTHRQVLCKEPSATQQANYMIMQTKWVQLKNRSVLVLTSVKGIQFYEYDGSAMLFWQALPEAPETADQCNFARGIAGLGDDHICVGTQKGQILMFDVPAKGTNVTQSCTVEAHEKSGVCDLASENDTLVSCDEEGNIIVWKLAGAQLQKQTKINGNGEPCSSLALWKGVLVAAFGNGQIKVFDVASGKLGATVSAHARWINSLDVARDNGLCVSASEDSFVRVWQLVPGPVPSIEFKYAGCVTDQQLVGAQFVHSGGRGFCVAGYDCSDLTFFVQQ